MSIGNTVSQWKQISKHEFRRTIDFNVNVEDKTANMLIRRMHVDISTVGFFYNFITYLHMISHLSVLKVRKKIVFPDYELKHLFRKELQKLGSFKLDKVANRLNVSSALNYSLNLL